jgi:hypothetical protein
LHLYFCGVRIAPPPSNGRKISSHILLFLSAATYYKRPDRTGLGPGLTVLNVQDQRPDRRSGPQDLLDHGPDRLRTGPKTGLGTSPGPDHRNPIYNAPATTTRPRKRLIRARQLLSNARMVILSMTHSLICKNGSRTIRNTPVLRTSGSIGFSARALPYLFPDTYSAQMGFRGWKIRPAEKFEGTGARIIRTCALH